MNSARSRGATAAILLAFLTFLATACRRGEAATRARPAPAVTVAQVEVRDVPIEVLAPVDLRPIARADVVSKTLGYLDTVLVDRGDRVRAGQLLAIVRPSDLPDQLLSARASLDLAKTSRDRVEKLAPSGVVSEQEVQQAEAGLASASANLAALATRLGETKITSPLDGFVSARRLDPGALVGPNSGAGSILSVERADTLRVFVPVNERDAAGLRVGLAARVEVDALPGRSYTGTVSRVSPAYDPVTRTLDAEVQLKNPGELRSGMYGRGAIVLAVHPKAVVVPAGVVILSNDRTYAFVVDGDKARRVEIRLGYDGGDWLEVVSGLAPGTEVVTAGADGLGDGSPIRAVRGVDPFTGKSPAPPAAAK